MLTSDAHLLLDKGHEFTKAFFEGLSKRCSDDLVLVTVVEMKGIGDAAELVQRVQANSLSESSSASRSASRWSNSK